MRNLAEITNGLDIESAGADLGAIVPTDITEDSRDVRPGALFVARPGTRHDGRRFIAGAIEQGAAAILTDHAVDPAAHAGAVAILRTPDIPRTTAMLAERFFGDPGESLTLIGVTGTNGKTTIAHLIQQALRGAGRPCGLIGTVAIDDGRTRRPATLTTPSAIDVSRALARMRDNGCVACAMEVSSHALHQGRVAAIGFDVGVFTNLTGDHLDYHATMDAYAEAKATLFRSLDPGAAGVFNADDPAHERMARACRASIVRCSGAGAPHADYAIAPLELTIHAIRARVTTPGGDFEIRSPLIGAHNLMNLLEVIAVLERLGVSREAIRSAVASGAAPPGRLEPVRPDGVDAPFAVLVDYAHTDDALDNVLRAVRPFVAGDLHLVFGCGGDRDRTKRPRMARVACRHADTILVTSDNPRTEDPMAIIDEVLAGIPGEALSRVRVEPDRAAAIALAIDGAAPDDLVLIAGKGHEDYQILPGDAGGIVRRDFDDRLVAADALRRRFARRDHAARSPMRARS